MTSIVAKPQSVLRFLYFQGWQLVETNKMYYLLKHSDFVDFKLPVLHNKEVEDFSFQINKLVEYLADFYRWDKTLLLLFVSIESTQMDGLLQQWMRSIMQEKLAEGFSDQTPVARSSAA